MTDTLGRFARRRLGIIVCDLAGWTKNSRRNDDLDLIAFLDAYYELCHRELAACEARVLKFMGDSCMAIIEPEKLPALIASLPEIHGRIEGLGEARGMPLRPGTNVHIAKVAAGDMGPEPLRRFDIIGSGVNHVFLMGGGPGIRISEPVYRALPNQARGPWSKHRPPATYSFSADNAAATGNHGSRGDPTR